MFEDFLSQIEEAKKNLKDVDENIKRITGRDPNDYFLTTGGSLKLKRELNRKFIGNNSSFQQQKRPIRGQTGARETSPVPKKSVKSAEGEREICQKDDEEDAFTDESSDEEGTPSKKPSIQSRIVATKKRVKSRKEVMEEQKSDSRGVARNRRMLGFMLGTLKKFREEEKHHRTQVEKRAEIDKKLENAAAEQKEQMQKEKLQMFIARRKQQSQIRCLEKKMERVETHKAWENSNKSLSNFIRTKTHPVIMFTPAKHNQKSRKVLAESQKINAAIVKAQKVKMERELQELDKWYMKDYENDKEETSSRGSKFGNVLSWLENVQSIKKIDDGIMSSDRPKQTLEKNSKRGYSPAPNTGDGTEYKTVIDCGFREDFDPIYE